MFTSELPFAPDLDHDDGPPPSMGTTPPSGVLGVELDLATDHPTTLTDTDLVDAAIGLERLVAWATARQAAVLAEFARRPADPAARPSAVREWAGYEIAMALTLSRGSADIRLAHATRLDSVLHPTRDLLEAGELDGSRVRLICDRLAVLDDDKAAAVQERVLGRAPGQTWGQLDASIRRAILAVDADGAAERHQAAKKTRRVDVFPDDDGIATFWARMSAPDAAASFEWLTRLARGMGAEDPRTLDQRRADLVAAALTGKLVLRDPTADPDDLVTTTPVTPGKPLITVIVPYSTLTGANDQPCELAGYGPIPAHLARDIAADSVWRRLLVDPISGTLLDYGRTQYRPPAGLADFVRGRDVTCRRPGCPRAAATCELDHVIAWNPDGTTDEANLCTLCTADHDLKEQPGWQVVLHNDRRVEWITPTGYRYWSAPHDYRRLSRARLPAASKIIHSPTGTDRAVTANCYPAGGSWSATTCTERPVSPGRTSGTSSHSSV